MAGTAPIQAPDTTFAALIWPARSRPASRALRGAVLAFVGACLLTVSAKVQVPGPVPTTLQTLAVLVLGAGLGLRHGLGAVALYLAEGAAGLPVFANTPPLAPGLAYLLGPSGGFLLGFVPAVALVGLSADRGLLARPARFAAVLAGAAIVILASGLAWLALVAQVGPAAGGIGFAKAFAVGVSPFLAGEAVKVALAALALPLVFDALGRVVRR